MRARLAAPLALALLLAIASLAQWPSARAIPTPSVFLHTLVAEAAGPTLWVDVLATRARLGAGLAIAIAVGASAGLALGASGARWRALEPTVDFVRAIPPILTFPLFLLALGYGEAARVLAVAFGTTFIVLLHVATGVARAPRARADAARLAGLTGARAVLHLHAWEALSSLLLGVRLAIAAGLIIVVVTEMIVGADHGLGARALAALLSYRADLLWLVILVAGTLGQALSLSVGALSRRLVHWEP